MVVASAYDPLPLPRSSSSLRAARSNSLVRNGLARKPAWSVAAAELVSSTSL